VLAGLDYERTVTGVRHAQPMRNRHRRAPLISTVLRRTVLTVAAGMLLAGCSDGPSTSSAAPDGAAATGTGAATEGTAAGGTGTAGKLDPCAMLTTDQVTTALGETPAPGKRTQVFDTPKCEWEPASGHNGTVTLEVGPWEGDPGIKPLKAGTQVSGIGDQADDHGGTGLYVRKGSRGLWIWVFNVHSQSSPLGLEKQLAAIVLAEL
jgi:Protein of unknown function (DUF3558)